MNLGVGNVAVIFEESDNTMRIRCTIFYSINNSVSNQQSRIHTNKGKIMAANSSQINVTDLDFDSISDNLKNYLKGQDKFKDYDFEGSSMSVLIDLLSYASHILQ